MQVTDAVLLFLFVWAVLTSIHLRSHAKRLYELERLTNFLYGSRGKPK